MVIQWELCVIPEWSLTIHFWRNGESMVKLGPLSGAVRVKKRWLLEEGEFMHQTDTCISQPANNWNSMFRSGQGKYSQARWLPFPTRGREHVLWNREVWRMTHKMPPNRIKKDPFSGKLLNPHLRFLQMAFSVKKQPFFLFLWSLICTTLVFEWPFWGWYCSLFLNWTCTTNAFQAFMYSM